MFKYILVRHKYIIEVIYNKYIILKGFSKLL